jgi:methionyl aminopeptidase
LSITIKNPDEIEIIRRAGHLQADILNQIGAAVAPGVSTKALDNLARELCKKNDVQPGFLGYHGFPAAICASVNNQVVHCIPSEQAVLQDGDLFKIDFGLILEGFYADACQTFAVGEISSEAKQLMKITKEALYAGIAQARADNRVGDISHAIEATVQPYGYSPVRETVGHGIGRRLHEDPEVPNWGKAGTGPKLVPGMTICIEPIINAGTHQIKTLPDGWTTETADGALSAHFEHQILITDGKPEILTPWDRI